MSDERLDTIDAPSAETTEIKVEKDWELAVESLNIHMTEETPSLIDIIYQHFLDLGYRYSEIAEEAAASGAEKKLRSFMRREVKASYRKDIEMGRKLVEWQKALDRPQETEQALATIFSEVGLGVAFGLLGKWPDTYTKPNVRATDTERRRQVAIAILDELVADVTVANETDPKNDLTAARIGNLVKTYTLPEVGDRVEFDKTMRGVAVELIDGTEDTLDGVIVRIDGSGEEKALLRGQKKFTAEPIARLHEAATVRGDNPEIYGQTVVVKNHEHGNSELLEVLKLDGTSVKIPASDLVRAKPKNAKVVGDLLQLVSDKGYLEKVEIAVESAKLPLFKQIDELNVLLEKRYEEGQIFAASSLKEQGKLNAIQPEAFLALPIDQKVEIFRAMPEEKQNTVLANIAPEVAKTAPAPLNVERAIEIQGENFKAETETEGDSTAKYSVPTSNEVAEVVEFLTLPAETPTPPTSSEVDPQRQIVESQSETEPKPAVTEEIESERAIESEFVEPSIDEATISRAEELLKDAFDLYQENSEKAKNRKNREASPEPGHITFHRLVKENPEVKQFLSHCEGRYFLSVIATEPWGAILSDIDNWGIENPDSIRERIDSASDEVYCVANLFRAKDKDAIAPLNKRLKNAAQYGCLTKEERRTIASSTAKTKKVKATEETKTSAPVQTEETNSPDIDQIRGNLLSNTHCAIAFKKIADYGLSLEEVISPDELQAFCNKGEAHSLHAERILERLERQDYLSF